MAKAATAFPLDTTAKIQTILATVPEQIANRYFALESASQAAQAAANAKTARVRLLRDDKVQIEARKERTLREFRKLGVKTTTTAEDGTEKLDPQLAAIEGELTLVIRKIAEAESAPVPSGRGFGAAHDFLHRLPANVTLEEAELPPVELPKGVDLGSYYKAQVAKLEAIRKEGNYVWNLPPDRETVLARFDAAIDRAATPLKPGGCLRAFYEDERGKRHTDYPNPSPTIPRELLGRGIDDIIGVNAYGIMCALFPDAIKKSLRDQYEAEFTDRETISPAEKHKRIQVLKAREWDQMVLCEEIYLAATKAGVLVDRVKKTPAEILLGCKRVA